MGIFLTSTDATSRESLALSNGEIETVSLQKRRTMIRVTVLILPAKKKQAPRQVACRITFPSLTPPFSLHITILLLESAGRTFEVKS